MEDPDSMIGVEGFWDHYEWARAEMEAYAKKYPLFCLALQPGDTVTRKEDGKTFSYLSKTTQREHCLCFAYPLSVVRGDGGIVVVRDVDFIRDFELTGASCSVPRPYEWEVSEMSHCPSFTDPLCDSEEDPLYDKIRSMEGVTFVVRLPHSPDEAYSLKFFTASVKTLGELAFCCEAYAGGKDWSLTVKWIGEAGGSGILEESPGPIYYELSSGSSVPFGKSVLFAEMLGNRFLKSLRTP